jgi:hypothetical protein
MWKRPLYLPSYFNCDDDTLSKIEYLSGATPPSIIDTTHVNLVLLALRGERGLPRNLTNVEMCEVVTEMLQQYSEDPATTLQSMREDTTRFHIDGHNETVEASHSQLRSATACYLVLREIVNSGVIISDDIVRAHKYATHLSNMPSGIRTVNVFAGETVFMPHANVSSTLRHWCQSATIYLKSDDQCNPIGSTSKLIEQFLMIHPFRDGNGRFARWLLSLFIGAKGFPYAFCIHQSKWIQSLKYAHHHRNGTEYSRLNALIMKSMMHVQGYPNNFEYYISSMVEYIEPE